MLLPRRSAAAPPTRDLQPGGRDVAAADASTGLVPGADAGDSHSAGFLDRDRARGVRRARRNRRLGTAWRPAKRRRSTAATASRQVALCERQRQRHLDGRAFDVSTRRQPRLDAAGRPVTGRCCSGRAGDIKTPGTYRSARHRQQRLRGRRPVRAGAVQHLAHFAAGPARARAALQHPAADALRRRLLGRGARHRATRAFAPS